MRHHGRHTPRTTLAFLVFQTALAFLALGAILPAGADSGPTIGPELRDHHNIALLIDPADGSILDANDSALHFYGYSLATLRSMRIQDINRLSSAEVAMEFRRARDEQRNYFIFPHRLADGTIRSVEVYSSPFVDATGRRLLLSLIHDATGKLLMDEELQRYQTRMEVLVAEKSEALDRERGLRRWLTAGGFAIMIVSVALAAIATMLRRTRDQLRLDTRRQEMLLQLDHMADAPVDEVMAFALEAALVSASSRIGFVGLMTEDESVMIVHAWSKEVLAQCRTEDATLQFQVTKAGLWAECIRQRRPLIINETLSDHPAARGVPVGHVPLTRLLTVPVTHQERIVAVVAVANKKSHYNDSDIRALTVLLQRVWLRMLRNRDKARVEAANREIKLLLESIPIMLVRIDPDTTVVRWNETAQTLFGLEPEEVLGRPLVECALSWDWPEVERAMDQCRDDRASLVHNLRFERTDGHPGLLELTASAILDESDTRIGLLIQGREVTHLRQLETQLLQSQKLEAIGQLAAGIAHEINTPAQFVGDNTQFLRQAIAELLPLLETCQDLVQASREGRPTAELVQKAVQLAGDADLDFLRTHLPLSAEHIEEGVQRIGNVVRSMREFAHPGGREKTLTDLNRVIENTIVVARNEYKFVADMETDLDPDLPQVVCLTDDIKQALLNVVINATHAIRDVVGDNPERRGTIRIATASRDGAVEIRVSDTGTGIPEAIRSRIFDPFFTTKPVGGGTGQGLSIAYAAIVDKHGGTITFETELGRGTTFVIRLPTGHDGF
ncbi:PAS domain S-box protein [Pseudodesulfovibrio sp. F-1]|uniref:histidine kinase n=1 Tax=Pseudodesulfovibrio alkaliphilus TaxID=2661613 RepID=A0A7K1KPR0_9BACT|nr:GAF domain-containing protein [Pseudodesulfovibrio alkaliphilus]MUM77970.1 PAS domain S-box protein [Pseudodesulfovibrio alkaliphilus]